nr:hypothetical protein [Burkholderia mayonis]
MAKRCEPVLGAGDLAFGQRRHADRIAGIARVRIVSFGAELDAEQVAEPQRVADRRRDEHVGGGHDAAQIARIAMPLHERARRAGSTARSLRS